MIKITLVKTISESPKFLVLLKKYSFTAERIFPSNDKKFRIEIAERNPSMEKELHDCDEVFDFIVKENSESEDTPL
jgi:hypothetical protein